MPRLSAPDAIRDGRPADASRAALDNARDALDTARKALDDARASVDGGPRIPAPDVDLAKVGGSIRRTIDDVLTRTSEAVARTADSLPDRAPDTSAVAQRLPKRADILAAVPAAVDVARRVPSLAEVRSSAEDAAAAAREAALEAARATPLRHHPAIRKGPGPLGIVLRIGFASLLASAVALVILNRERVRTALIEARTRAARAAAMRRGETPGSETAWGTAIGGGTSVTVDEVIAVDTAEDPFAPAGTSVSSATSGAPTTTDEPAEDLDAMGWGTEGRPTAPRQLSSDVAAMTNPSPRQGNPQELGE